MDVIVEYDGDDILIEKVKTVGELKEKLRNTEGTGFKNLNFDEWKLCLGGKVLDDPKKLLEELEYGEERITLIEPKETKSKGVGKNWFGVANSTEHKFKVKTYNERARQTDSGGHSGDGELTLPAPVDASVAFGASAPLRSLEMSPMMSQDTLIDINSEEYKQVRVPTDDQTKGSLIEVKIYKEGQEDEHIFADRIKPGKGVIIIQEDENDKMIKVINAKGQLLPAYRWKPDSGYRNRNRKETYDPSQNVHGERATSHTPQVPAKGEGAAANQSSSSTVKTSDGKSADVK